jgi:hypothetical protein
MGRRRRRSVGGDIGGGVEHRKKGWVSKAAEGGVDGDGGQGSSAGMVTMRAENHGAFEDTRAFLMEEACDGEVGGEVDERSFEDKVSTFQQLASGWRDTESLTGF